MAIKKEVAVRDVGYNPDNIFEMFERQPEQSGAAKDFDKSPWFNSPLPKLNITETGIYTFDVLQFKVSCRYHPFWAKRGYFDMGEGFYWFEKPVTVHEAFGSDARSVVCSRTFACGKGSFDPACAFLWDHKEEYDYKKFNKNYSIFVIRMHPNDVIGNKEYKYFAYVAGRGMFAAALYDEYNTCIAAKDRDNGSFFRYDETGKTIRARFVKETNVIDGKQIEWVGCNKVDFLTRKDPISEDDVKMLMNLDIDSYITKGTTDEYNSFVSKISGKVDRAPVERDNTAPVVHAQAEEDTINW